MDGWMDKWIDGLKFVPLRSFDKLLTSQGFIATFTPWQLGQTVVPLPFRLYEGQWYWWMDGLMDGWMDGFLLGHLGPHYKVLSPSNVECWIFLPCSSALTKAASGTWPVLQGDRLRREAPPKSPLTRSAVTPPSAPWPAVGFTAAGVSLVWPGSTPYPNPLFLHRDTFPLETPTEGKCPRVST